jgi:hypothetical protein
MQSEPPSALFTLVLICCVQELADIIGDNDESYAHKDWYHRHRDAIDAATAEPTPVELDGPPVCVSCFDFDDSDDPLQGGEGREGGSACYAEGGIFSGMGMFDDDQ